MIKPLLIIAYFACITSFLSAQDIAITLDGDSVILYNDNTWELLKDTNNTTNSIDFSCDGLLETTIDKVTGKSSVASRDMVIVSQDGGKNGFGIYLIQGQNGIIMITKAIGAGNCIDDDDEMNVLFRDGSRLTFTNDGDFNCDLNFTLYFGGMFGKKKELSTLASKEIETMRVWTNDGYVEEDFDADESKQLQLTFQCLSNS